MSKEWVNVFASENKDLILNSIVRIIKQKKTKSETYKLTIKYRIVKGKTALFDLINKLNLI